MANGTIPVVIPSLDPDQNLLDLVKELHEMNIKPVMIVNDGSDQSYDHFFQDAHDQYDCVILRHAVNLGKGRALKDAFNACLNQYNDLIGVVTADSDGQHAPADIQECINLLRKNPNDLILGCRDFKKDNIPWKSEFGNRMTIVICRLLCGISVHDTQTGLRGISKAFMKQLLNVPGERFEFETRMLIVSKDHVHIREFPIATIYRSKENHQTHFDPVKDSIRIYKIFAGVFVKFLFSSLSSSVIDLFLFHVFCRIFFSSSAYVAIATVLARIISATYNYLINYAFVFQSSVNHKSSALRYFALAIIQMLCSAALTTIGVKAAGGNEMVVKIVVDVFLFFISYSIQREYVYSNHKNKK